MSQKSTGGFSLSKLLTHSVQSRLISPHPSLAPGAHHRGILWEVSGLLFSIFPVQSAWEAQQEKGPKTGICETEPEQQTFLKTDFVELFPHGSNPSHSK